MNSKRKKIILEILRRKLNKAEKIAQKREETAKDFKFASRSQQGDKLYFQNAAQMAQDRLEVLKSLMQEITQAAEKSPEKVQTPCYIEIKYSDGQKKAFYFVQNGITLEKYQLITPESPIGSSLQNKKTGEKFSYQTGKSGQTFSGEITKIQ